jgi:hypothetical protein
MIEGWVWDATGPTVIIRPSDGTSMRYRVGIDTWLLARTLEGMTVAIERQTQKYEEIMVGLQSAQTKGETSGRTARAKK